MFVSCAEVSALNTILNQSKIAWIVEFNLGKYPKLGQNKLPKVVNDGYRF